MYLRLYFLRGTPFGIAVTVVSYARMCFDLCYFKLLIAWWCRTGVEFTHLWHGLPLNLHDQILQISSHKPCSTSMENGVWLYLRESRRRLTLFPEETLCPTLGIDSMARHPNRKNDRRYQKRWEETGNDESVGKSSRHCDLVEVLRTFWNSF